MAISIVLALLAALPEHVFPLIPRVGYWVDAETVICWNIGRRSEALGDTAWSIERIGTGVPLRMSSWTDVPVPERLPGSMLRSFRGSRNAVGQVRMVGWPFRCLWGGVLFDKQLGIPGSPTAVVRTPVHLFEPAWLSGFMKDRGVDGGLPVGVAWRGMLLDALVWSAVCWAVFAVPRVARHLRRRRQGRCLGCGYDLAGSASQLRCPECGRPMAVAVYGLQQSSGSSG